MSSDNLPVVTIQSDWNDIIRLPKGTAWISYKYLNQNSVHDNLTTSVNNVDGKIKIQFSENYQYISHSNISLVLKHMRSGIKVAFIAPTKVHNVHGKAVLSVSAAENALAISACEGDKLLVWDSRTGEVLLDLKGHGGPVYKCRFFPSGVVALSVGADGSSRIWSAESGVNPVTLIGHTMAVMDACIVDKGRNVLTVSRDGTSKLWDVGESRCLANVIEGCPPINCCNIGTIPDEFLVENEREVGTSNKVLVVGCESGDIICAHVAKRAIIFSRNLASPCNACIILDQVIIVGMSNGKIEHINIHDGNILKSIHESASPVLSMLALPNQMYVVGRQDGTCTVFSTQDNYNLVRIQLTGSDCDGIRDLAFNGKWIFAACRDTTIRKYDYNQIVVHYK